MADTPDQPRRRRTTKRATTPKAAADPAPKTETSASPKPARKPAARKPAASKAAASKPKTVKPAVAVAAEPAPAAAAKPKTKTTQRKAATSRAKATPAPAPRPTAVAAAVERAREALPELPPRTGLFAALGTLAVVGGAFFVWKASRADEPRYQTIESDGPIEVRKYPMLVTAGTEQRGSRDQALNEGFRVLADYIFAKSRPGKRLPMTAPVLSDSDGDGSWRTRFIMPSGQARAELPATPAGVDLVSEPAARVAALRFSGRADEATLAAKEGALRSWLQLRGLPSEGKAIYAYYNAPFLPGPMRRNEVMIVLSDEGGMSA